MNAEGELIWAVKDSFLRYVRVIAAGVIRADEGADERPDGSFVWPLEDARRESDELILRFRGSVRFTAHGGFLDVDLRDPWLFLSSDGGTLSIAREDTGERVLIASTEPSSGGDALVPKLTPAGVEVFGSVYATGTALAPLSARVPINS